jgi:phage tail tube protein FII|nr:MAG TPA: tail tube protein [Caudoviricetes sp.]
MSLKSIPTKLTDYNIYNDGEILIGTSGELTLPDLEAITSEISGAGIAGTIEDPTPGYFGSLEVEIKFRTVSEESSRLAIPQAHTLTARAAQTRHDPATGTNSQEGLKVVFRGVCKTYSIGTFKQGESTETTATMELSYIKITRGSTVVLELDKFNHIYVVEGVDYMKAIRDLI